LTRRASHGDADRFAIPELRSDRRVKGTFDALWQHCQEAKARSVDP
jgi:hypothetical protein